MEIKLKKAGTIAELEQIRELYLTNFPTNERRSFEGLQQQFLREDACSILQITNMKSILGFCTLWEFEIFAFIEHLAILPEMRGKKIGEAVLYLLKNGRKTPLILETELPNDEICSRRISFYQRNGFHLLNQHYIQPSYDGITPGPELKLMISHPHISHEDLQQYIEVVKRKVYRQK